MPPEAGTEATPPALAELEAAVSEADRVVLAASAAYELAQKEYASARERLSALRDREAGKQCKLTQWFTPLTACLRPPLESALAATRGSRGPVHAAARTPEEEAQVVLHQQERAAKKALDQARSAASAAQRALGQYRARATARKTPQGDLLGLQYQEQRP